MYSNIHLVTIEHMLFNPDLKMSLYVHEKSFGGKLK